MKTVRVLVVDDSLFMRESLAHELERDVSIKVVGKVSGAVEARDFIVEYLPDILVMDANLGDMDGVEFLRKLLPQYYLPVIMIGSDPRIESAARKANAAAFVLKPKQVLARVPDDFFRHVLAQIRAIVSADTTRFDVSACAHAIVAIGASTGGAEALETVLRSLPALMPPVVIAQHMPARFTYAFAARMNSCCSLSVKEAQEGDLLIPGQVYVAPGGINTRIKRSGDRFYVSLVDNPTNNHACPSVDEMFHSVAEATGGRAVAVLLTGMGKDGAAGIEHLHSLGSKTVGQDEASSVVYGMPKVAFDNGSIDYQLPLDMIAQKIQVLVGQLLSTTK